MTFPNIPQVRRLETVQAEMRKRKQQPRTRKSSAEFQRLKSEWVDLVLEIMAALLHNIGANDEEGRHSKELEVLNAFFAHLHPGSDHEHAGAAAMASKLKTS